jgi:hypothetical protein
MLFRVTVENKEKGTTEVYDDLKSMMLVMLSRESSDVIFENEFVNDVPHEEDTFELLSLAQGYVFVGLTEYRNMVRRETHNDILAQQSLDFIWDLVQKRAKEIKEQAYAEEE